MFQGDGVNSRAGGVRGPQRPLSRTRAAFREMVRQCDKGRPVLSTPPTKAGAGQELDLEGGGPGPALPWTPSGTLTQEPGQPRPCPQLGTALSRSAGVPQAAETVMQL